VSAVIEPRTLDILGEVVANHFRLDFNRVEDLAVVNANDRADHFGDDDHVTEVCLDDSGFFVRRSLLLCLAEFLDEAHWATFETALEPTASASMDELDGLLDFAKILMGQRSHLHKLEMQREHDIKT
jgi:hypothetical protein